MPDADLRVSQQHRVLVKSKIAQRLCDANEVLVAAKLLLQIDGVDAVKDLPEVGYFHILFDRHEVIYANGAQTESLFTGPGALKSVGKAASEEILSIFPQLNDEDYAPEAIRPIPSGRVARKMIIRHLQNKKPLVQQF